MNETWKSHLRGDCTEWLLNDNGPAIRYLTLRALLDRHDGDRDVTAARAAMLGSEMMKKLFGGQERDGSWGAIEDYYQDRYGGAAWRLMLFADLCLDRSEPVIDRTAQFIFRHSQRHENGGFASRCDRDGNPCSDPTPCLTGNMVAALVRLGYLDDPRTQTALAWMCRYARFDDGAFVDGRPEWMTPKHEDCWGSHTCMQGAIAILDALSWVPMDRRSAPVVELLKQGAEYVLIHHVYKRSHSLDKPISGKYKQLGYPLYYHNDMLRMLMFLTRLGIRDDRMDEAVDYLLSKQDRNGRWRNQRELNGTVPVDMGKKGETSAWVTLRACTALKQYFSLVEV